MKISELGKGVASGERRKSPPPENRKMVLFPKALFLVTNFQTKNKNKKFYFSIEFSPKTVKFSQNFPTICVFCQKTRKINPWFGKLF